MTDGRAGGSRARTVFLGSGGFGVEAPRRLAGHPDIELVGVVTAPARPAGRGAPLATTPIEAAARSSGIAAILTPSAFAPPSSIAAVEALGPELLVLADYGQIVPADCSTSATVRSTCIRRCCRDIAARHRSRRRSWPVTRRPA